MAVPLLRTLILYCAVICAVRLMGKRQIGELDPSELVVTILVSDLAAVPMQDLGIPLLSGLVPIATLVVLEIFLSFAALKSRRFRRLLNGQPAIIIRRGQLDIGKLRQMRLTTDEVIETLRKQNVAAVSDVKYGVIEPDGTLTVILKQPQQPVTAEMLGITPKDTGLPLVVVSDGRVVPRSLELLHLSPADIERRLKNQSIAVEDVSDDARRLRQHVPAEKGGPCMKRLLTAAVLCTVLILGSVWSIKAVDNTAQAVALDVENDRLNEARETWDAAQTLLGALLLHSEIDQADQLFDRVLVAQQNGLTDEFSLDRAELLAQLRHLPEVQRPTLKNLF
ncbi:MAG: DUF4363 family protein [Butyricicoccus sp.]